MSKQRIEIHEINRLSENSSASNTRRSSPIELSESGRKKQAAWTVVERYMRAGLDQNKAVIAYGVDKLVNAMQEAGVDAQTGDKLLKEILRSGRGPEAPEFTNLFGTMLESL